MGRPPLGEYLGFLTSQTVDGQTEDLNALAEEWRCANDHILWLEQQEAKFADSPEIGDIPPELDRLGGSVLADPMFQRSYNMVPSRLGFVPLDRLVVFQKHINLEYVEALKRSIGPSPTPDAIFRLCLPFDHPQPSVRAMQIGPKAFAFVSPSTDLRVLERPLLPFHKLRDYPPQGAVSGILARMVGFGSNFLNVIHAEGRLILNNGSHRAYTLRDLGMTHAPCIIQYASRRDELDVICPALRGDADIYLKAPRPPVLKDYFDEKLRKLIWTPKKQRQVRIMFETGEVDLPAAQM